MRHSEKFVPFCHGMRSHFQVQDLVFRAQDYFIFASLVINCPVLDSPPKSVLLTIPCVRTYGSKCSFTCQTGYSSLTGNVTRTCLASGLWSGNSINCSGRMTSLFYISQNPVVQKVNSDIHGSNFYSVISAIGLLNTFPLERDLSDGQRYPSCEQLGPDPTAGNTHLLHILWSLR